VPDSDDQHAACHHIIQGRTIMTSISPTRLYAATGDAVARLDSPDLRTAAVTHGAEGSGAQCVAADPGDPAIAVAGTFDNGLLRTEDGGQTWPRIGERDIPFGRVLSVAISPVHVEDGHHAIYAGTEPSHLYRSLDGGATWRDFPALPELPSAPEWSFPPRPWTSHVRWIALGYADPDLIFAGIELGGVMRSVNGGETWEDWKQGSQRDSHAIATHPTARERVYEAAGGGVAWSWDTGDSWGPVDEGMDRHYTWGLAIDPVDPDLWYVSASFGPRQAHDRRGHAQGVLYRKRRDQPWEPLGHPEDGANGAILTHPSPRMPYALATLPGQPGSLVAGLRDGAILLSEDAGDNFRELALDGSLDSLLALSVAPRV
jgi:photosystem II stability/assembly factor-like uncharacterized protein